MKLTDKQRRLIIAIQEDEFPLVAFPYREIGKRVGMSEAEVIKELQTLIDNDIIRKICVIVRHRLMGYDSNAMVAWSVPDEDIHKTGEIMASYREISHCYVRVKSDEWPYNLYTMIHAHNEDELDEIISKISEHAKIENFVVLKTLKEFKKESMKYSV